MNAITPDIRRPYNLAKWKRIRLGDVVELAYGKSLPKGARAAGSIPVYGSNGLAGRHNIALVKEPTVIVGRKGSAGAIQLVTEPCYPIDTTYYTRVRPGYELDVRFLAYALRNLNLGRLKTSTGVPGLNREDAYRDIIPLPSLAEQLQVVDRLSRAENIVRMRREAEQKAKEIIPALFLDMFGDGRTGLIVTVADCVDPGKGGIRTGPFGSQLLHSEFTSQGVAVLGIDNAVKNRFDGSAKRFISSKKYEQLKRYTVYPGDVLITIMGTCGRCAVVPMGIPTTINTKHLCAITLSHTQCMPEYLHAAFLYDVDVRRQLAMATKGAIMGGLNMQIIKSLRIHLPSIDLQRAFRCAALRYEELREVSEKATHQAHTAFQSLLAEAFGESA